LNKILNDANVKDPAKKIWKEFDKLTDSTTPKKTDGLFGVLNTLITDLSKANPGGDTPKTWKTNLTTVGDKKDAWVFVNTQTKTDDDYKPNGWADKVAAAELKRLTDAIVAAKGKMKGEDEAPTKTDIDNQESIKTAEAIGNLFALCKEAYGSLDSNRAVTIISELTGYRDGDTVKKAAWTAVNLYEKTTGKKYADEALVKAEAAKKTHSEN
jgi:hypothetical protein